jgi:hypothetical protein
VAHSLLNIAIDPTVGALLDRAAALGGDYPDDLRFYSRAKAAAIIHAALWAYASRSDSTAGAYAAGNLFDAIGLKAWTFNSEEAATLNEIRAAKFRKADVPAQTP